MKYIRKMRLAAALLAVTALVLCAVGCGAKEDNKSKKKNGTSAENAPESTVTTAPEGKTTPTETPNPQGDPNDPGKDNQQGDPGRDTPYTGILLIAQDIPVKYGDKTWTFHSYEGGRTMTDYGIFCSENVPKEDGSGETLVYRLVDPETGKSEQIAMYPNAFYESRNARILMGNKLYTTMMGGDYRKFSNDSSYKMPLFLLEFDLEKRTVKEIPVCENGHPYTSLTEVGGNILITNLDPAEGNYVSLYGFAPGSGSCQEVLRIPAKEGDVSVSLRAVCADNNRLYLLRVLYSGEYTGEMMYVDCYDEHFTKIGETDVTAIFREAVLQSCCEEDIATEMTQMTAQFRIIDGDKFYFENMSSTSLFADLSTGKILADNGICLAQTSDPAQIFFYWSDPDRAVADTTHFYRYKDGALVPVSLPDTAPDDRVVVMSVAPNGTAYIMTEQIVNDDMGAVYIPETLRVTIVSLAE